jgi:methyltransferase (TIGR00027 family)
VASTSSPIQGVADTARWVAIYRAIETERPDAIFRDPYARRLAGPRGREISDSMPQAMRAAWAFVARTVLYDLFIQQQVQAGVTLVVNLAAGMDARPYRMALPPDLRWVEVDQPQLLAEKAALLADCQPVCSLERIALDLEAEGPRRELLQRLGGSADRALVITEGLLAYLSEVQVGRLAEDLAAQPAFRSWIVDLTSPRLLQIIQKQWGRRLAEGDAPLKFAPDNGPAFFSSHGWQAVDVRSTLTTAARMGRLPLFLRLVARIPATGRFHPRRPWSGVCLLVRTARDETGP